MKPYFQYVLLCAVLSILGASLQLVRFNCHDYDDYGG